MQKVKRHSVPKSEWKETEGQTDGQTNGVDCITCLASAVGDQHIAGRASDSHTAATPSIKDRFDQAQSKPPFTLLFVITPPHGVGSGLLRWAGLSVSLSVRSHISATTCPNFTKLSMHVTCRCGLILLCQRWDTTMLCTFGLVDGVMCP